MAHLSVTYETFWSIPCYNSRVNDRDFGLLQRCPLFRSTPEAQLRAQVERVPHGVSEYEADALIRSQGDCYDELLILLRDIAHRTEFLATKLRMVQFETLRERVAHYLLELMRSQRRPTVELPVAKRELADILDPERLRSLAEAAE